MGQEPGEIREQIEQTRDEMGETIDAIGYKADVKQRTREKVSGKVESVRSKFAGAGSRASEVTPSGGDVKEGAQRAAGVAQENPLGLAIGAAALGFVAGLAAPTTRLEDEKLGPVADQLKDKAKETGQEAIEHGKQVAQEAAQSAKETAQESAQQHGEKLKTTAQEKAQEAQQAARPS